MSRPLSTMIVLVTVALVAFNITQFATAQFTIHTPPMKRFATICDIQPNDPGCNPTVLPLFPNFCDIYPKACMVILPAEPIIPPQCLTCPPLDLSSLKVGESILVTPVPNGGALLSKVINNVTNASSVNIPNATPGPSNFTAR